MVQLKKKVTIKTKTAQEETPVAVPKPEVKIKKKAPVAEEPKVATEAPKTPTTPPTPPTPPEENGGSKSWMWIVALIVVAVIAFFGYRSCSGAQTDDDTTSVVSDSTQTEKSDSTVAEKPETAEGTDEKPEDNAGGTNVPAAPVSGSVEENARRVIRGDFGNGKIRKDKLGASYSEIQSRVNEMYRQGLVK